MGKIDVLISEKQIESRIAKLADEIMQDYKGKEIVFLGILKGSIVFMTDLAKKIKNDIEFEFMQLQSYEGENSTGKIEVKQDITGRIEGKDVIIIEDIVDTGRTLEFLLQYLEKFKPNSIKTCTLLSKPSRREIEVPIDYTGFTIENEFVIGYGMDYNQKYRNLPYIGRWRENV